MGRAPCCEKMGLKKGPWTPEEDNILVTYIQQYGHGNWRALPKLAGLLRCGKSCRLRWTNYLKPDIKRGNFSREEEDAIINLHQMLGNRWSAIAARLPGRTDNEIKNVWHTHLKKRLKQTTTTTATATAKTEQDPKPFNASSYSEESEVLDCGPVSPPQCTSSDTSSATTSGGSISNTDVASMKLDDFESSLPEADESFWSEVLSAENPDQMVNEFPAIDGGGPEVNVDHINEFSLDSLDMYVDNNMDFWFNIFPGAEGIPELLEIPEL